MPERNPRLVWYHFESMSDIKSMSERDPIVLDLCCGEGHLMKEIQRGQLVGLDLSREHLEQATTKAGPKFWVLADAENLPLRKNTFDAVVSHQALEHIGDRGRTIKETIRVLKPGGLFIASTPVPGALGPMFATSKNERGERVLSPDHISEYKSTREILSSVSDESNGQLTLVKIKRRTIRVPIGRFLPWLYRRGVAGPGLPAPLYYSDVYLVFRKRQSEN